MKFLFVLLALVAGGITDARAQPHTCGGVAVPGWRTSERPSGAVNNGTTGYNTTSGYCETYSAAAGSWLPPASGQSVLQQLSAQPATAANNLGFSQFLGSPYRQPRSTDDVTTGAFPSMVWRSNGETWVNVSNASGQAIWQKQEQFPLPGDVLGYYVSAAAAHSGGGGTGYAANDTITLEGGVVIKVVTVSAGAVSTISVTTPNMFGVCNPTTTAAPQLATSGSGSGATFDLTVLYPTLYAVRRVSDCYTGNLLQVQNSVTRQTKGIGYLPDNSMDVATAVAFGTGGAQMEAYANYNDGPVPGISIWYDQGPNGNNATQSTIAQQPVLFAGRRMGNSVAVLFNAQGGTGSYPYPSSTSLTIPSGVTLASANAAVFVGGGDVGAYSPLVTMNPVSGLSAAIFGFTDTNQYPACENQNTAGNASVNGNGAPIITETPAVYGCVWSGGVLQPDSTYFPAPSVNLLIGSYLAGATQTVTVTAGANCAIPASHTLSLTSGSSESYTAYTARLVAAINADPSFEIAGLTAQLSLINAQYSIALYQPVGSACSISSASSNGGTYFGALNVAQGAGWNFAGGTLGGIPSYSGDAFEGIVAIVPWAVTPAQAQMFRQSVHHHFQMDGHIGAVVTPLLASNMSGFLTPFLQDVPAELTKILGRDDIVVTNKTAAGSSYVSYAAPNFLTQGNLYNPLLYLNSGKPTNDLGLIFGEYNSLSTVGSNTAEYAAIQTVAGYYHAANWKTICAGEIQKNVTAIQSSEMVLLQASLIATPGACDVVLNPTALPVYDITYPGPWNWPIFTKSGSGSHVSAAGNALIESLLAETIRGMLQ